MSTPSKSEIDEILELRAAVTTKSNDENISSDSCNSSSSSSSSLTSSPDKKKRRRNRRRGKRGKKPQIMKPCKLDEIMEADHDELSKILKPAEAVQRDICLEIEDIIPLIDIEDIPDSLGADFMDIFDDFYFKNAESSSISYKTLLLLDGYLHESADLDLVRHPQIKQIIANYYQDTKQKAMKFTPYKESDIFPEFGAEEIMELDRELGLIQPLSPLNASISDPITPLFHEITLNQRPYSTDNEASSERILPPHYALSPSPTYSTMTTCSISPEPQQQHQQRHIPPVYNHMAFTPAIHRNNNHNNHAHGNNPNFFQFPAPNNPAPAVPVSHHQQHQHHPMAQCQCPPPVYSPVTPPPPPPPSTAAGGYDEEMQYHVREISRWHALSNKEIVNKEPALSILIKYDLITRLISDQNGCRYLQNMIRDAPKSRSLEWVDCLIYHLISIKNHNLFREAQDIYGNYLIQVLFEIGNEYHHEILLNNFVFSNIYSLCQSKYGCRVIQTILKVVKCNNHLYKFCESMKEGTTASSGKGNNNKLSNILKCCNGNRVLQCLLELKLPFLWVSFIKNELESDLVFYSREKNACRVIQSFIHSYGDKINMLLLLDSNQSHLNLSETVHGNYVIQCIIENTKWYSSLKLFTSFRNKLIYDIFEERNLERFSKNKFGSNVIETCIKSSDKKQIDYLVTVLCRNQGYLLKQLMYDKFGNYIPKTLLENCFNHKQLIHVVNTIHNHIINLYTKSSHFKHCNELLYKAKMIKTSHDQQHNSSHSSQSTASSSSSSSANSYTNISRHHHHNNHQSRKYRKKRNRYFRIQQ